MPAYAACGISIHALLAESDHYKPCKKLLIVISIHALLAESDGRLVHQLAGIGISIHALLAESDQCWARSRRQPSSNFYPRSPCGERLRHPRLLLAPHLISIHALLAESDHPHHRSPWDQYRFLSTLSLRRATKTALKRGCFTLFLSTLSLRRATPTPYPSRGRNRNFYPRSPCGERLFRVAVPEHVIVISIHALLAESDVATVSLNLVGQIFLSTLSLRRATCWARSRRPPSGDFYPRSPCGERRFPISAHRFDGRDFYPRSPCGERRIAWVVDCWPCNFYPRSPCGERRRPKTATKTP